MISGHQIPSRQRDCGLCVCDGNQVKATFGSTTLTYVSWHYEKETMRNTVKYRKHYFAGDLLVAM